MRSLIPMFRMLVFRSKVQKKSKKSLSRPTKEESHSFRTLHKSRTLNILFTLDRIQFINWAADQLWRKIGNRTKMMSLTEIPSKVVVMPMTTNLQCRNRPSIKTVSQNMRKRVTLMRNLYFKMWINIMTRKYLQWNLIDKELRLIIPLWVKIIASEKEEKKV